MIGIIIIKGTDNMYLEGKVKDNVQIQSIFLL
jgi:hypothetical protein